MRFDKRHVVFVITLIILMISLVYRLRHPYEYERVEQLTYTGEKRAKAPAGESGFRKQGGTGGPAVEDPLLSGYIEGHNVSGTVINDLFAVYRPPRTPDTDRSVNRSNRNESNQPVQAGKSGGEKQKENPLDRIRKDILSYRFYGTYESNGRKAVFLVREKSVLVARTGDRLYGKYLIEEIREDYIRLKALELNETIHIDTREFNNE